MDAATEGRPVRVREGAAVWRRIEDETIVLALESSMYLGLNRTASALWPMLVEGTTHAELTRHLIGAFGIDADRAAEDVDAFIEHCRRQRLLAT